MSNRLIKYGFTAGIVAKELWSQTILQKYGFGVADARNYLFRFTGSAVSRPGLIVSAVMADADEVFRFVPFIFAKDDANNFSLIFTPNKLRFLQNGRYVLENAKTALSAVPDVNTTQLHVIGHGFAVGDLVELYGNEVPEPLRGQTVIVKSVFSSDKFSVGMIGAERDLDGWVSHIAFEVRRVYTLSTPFNAALLPSLYFKQARDIVRITAPTIAAYTLERESDGTWTLATAAYTIGIEAPTGLVEQGRSAGGFAGVMFTVTAVNEKGEESLPSTNLIIGNIVDYSTTAGWISIKWNPVPGAVRYNVYRSAISPDGTRISAAYDVGFLGTALGPFFMDKNVIPDFMKVPPSENDPFAVRPIKRVETTAVGTGYTNLTTLSVSDPTGTGAELIPVVVDGGIVSVLVKRPGRNYTNPVVTATFGTGAVFSVTLGEDDGNYPAISAIHKQRQMYAATGRFPLSFYGSQIGLFSNFNFSRVIASNESFSYELDSDVLGTIRHMISTRVGLLMLTDLGVWIVTGSQKSITPTDVNAELQTAVGCSDLPPIAVDSDILYAETDNQTVRLLQYNDFAKNFGGTDVSVLARHLLASPRDILTWAYENRPYKIVWAVRDDGQLLSLTLSQEQQVYAWSVHNTAGLFLANHTLAETEREVSYFVVRRFLSGRWVRTIEYLADRERSTNFTHNGVDAATPFGFVKVNARLRLSGMSEIGQTVTVEASSAVFTSDAFESVIIHDNGKLLITNVISSTKVQGTVIAPFTHLRIPQSTLLRDIPANTWFLAAYRSEITLPYNFRPDVVTICADAKVLTHIPVAADGLVTFPEELTCGYVGLNYECEMLTLPMTAEGSIIEDSRNNIKGVGIRFIRTRGLYVGVYNEEDREEPELFSVEDKRSPVFSEGSLLRDDHEYVPVSSDWDESNQIVIRANGANPTEVTGIVFDIEVGDEVR